MHAGRSNRPKFMRLAPADKAGLPIQKYKKIVFSSKRPSLSAWTTLTLNLPCFTREIIHV
jgi:hypothetical protein